MFGIDYMRKHFTRNQRYIIVAVFSLFLPFYMCAGVIMILTLRLLIKGEIQEAYRNIPYSQYLLAFCIISCIVSLFYSNYLGAAFCIVLVSVLSFMLYYRRNITPKLFEFILNCIIVMSMFAAFYGLLEYIGILNSFDIDQFEVIVFNAPKDRINSMFFNANYYAMMIEFFVLITFYKILKIKNFIVDFKKFFYYVLVICINLFMLLLTGCRTAWPTIIISMIIMLIVDGHYKTCLCIFSVGMFGLLYFLFNPSAFPRADNIVTYFFKRTDIWRNALLNIKTHPLFGEGTFTYMHVYQKYKHCHNIILEPFLSYGIVGVAIVQPYIISSFKSLKRLYKNKNRSTIVALMVGFTVTTLLHGLLDYTIFFVQTGMLYLFIASSFDCYKNKKRT